LATTVILSGIKHKLFDKAGVAGQAELGWGGSIGFQLSYQNWFLHGTVDKDRKWSFSLSFPNDSPLPVLPWVNSIFREASVAVDGFLDFAAAGPPDLTKFDAIMTQLSPHIDRTKNAIDAVNGFRKAQTGLNVSLTVGSGPAPGAEPAAKPSGIFFGGTVVYSF
jgi:hypothetical protein